MSSSGVLKVLNMQGKENASTSTSHKTKQKKNSSTLKKDGSSQSSRPVLASKENVMRKPKQQDKGPIQKYFPKHNSTSGKKTKRLEIFDETTKASKRFKSKSTQTISEDEAIQMMMMSDVPTEKYWELLAETRRKALYEALEENKQLADEIRAKDSEIEELKLDVERLEEISSHAQYLASLIEGLPQESSEEPQLELATSKLSFSSGDENDQALNTTSGNDRFNGKSADLSDGSCSHDSDKENKPLHGCAPLESDDSSEEDLDESDTEEDHKGENAEEDHKGEDAEEDHKEEDAEEDHKEEDPEGDFKKGDVQGACGGGDAGGD